MTRFTTQRPAVLFATLIAASSILGANTNTCADGNVTVTVSNNGNLRVKGENNTAQDIVITANAFDSNSVTFSNLDGTTTFNGANQLSVVGVDGKVRIDLGSGPKVLVMTEGDASRLTIADDLQISNRGNDPALIILDRIRVMGRTRITTKNGDDALVFFNSDFVEQAKIRTGNGNDVVAASDETYALDEYELNTGNGNDYAINHDTNIAEIDIRGGGQDDTTGIFASQVGFGRINGNNGYDTVEIDSPGMLPYSVLSIEFESNLGSGGMFAQARADNPVYELAVLLFLLLDLQN